MRTDAASDHRETSASTGPFTVFTVVARNYSAHARVLANSVSRHHPGCRLKVLVLDDEPHVTAGAEPFDRLALADLGIGTGEFQRMAGIYDLTELATSLKPWIFRRLLEATARPVIYLDPDIELFDSIEEAADLAARHGIVLTPHALEPMPRDGCMPGEREILLAGMYNLGFLALGGDVSRFLDWWQERLSWDCVIAPDQGLFVDQRWMDFVPGCFDHVILRDPSYNVAYWNVHGRPLRWTGTRYEVSGRPLRFFHFSGFSPDRPDELSRHQAGKPRVRLSDEPALAQLCVEYARRLEECGFAGCKHIPYGLECLRSGLVLDSRMRMIYRRGLLQAERDGAAVPSPLDPAEADRFLEWLRAPDVEGSDVSRYLRALYAERRDLQAAFPDLDGPDGRRFLEWVLVDGRAEPPIPELLRSNPRPRTLLPKAPLQRRSRPGPFESTGNRRQAGVNVVGYLRAENGVGEVARLLVTTLQEAGIPHAVVSWDETISRQEHPFPTGQLAEAVFDVNMICVNADELPHFISDAGAAFLTDRYNIGIWAWEVERFPDDMARNAGLLDEIWGISHYTADAIAPFVSRVVRPFLPPVPPPVTGRFDRADLGIPDGYLVLFAFDFDSIFERKNPLGVIDAFTRAFTAGEGPILVLKSVNGDRHPAELERLRAAATGRDDILIVDGYLEHTQFFALIELCDVYVSLHRAEGFGLTMAQAMSLGKPVVATGYSANSEFMSEENGCLVPYRLVPVAERCSPYPTTARWADPDVAEAARMLRRLFEHPREARAKGERARRDMSRVFSVEARADVMKQRWSDIRYQCIAKRMKSISWFHSMEIAPGLWTPGKQTDTHDMLKAVRMPDDLTGKSVLDVGAWDGFYSFEAERRGAGRVLATDSFCWGGEGWGTKAGFLFAREALRSKVEDLDIDCMDIAPERVGTWDVVLFMGVLYHLKNPLEALERMASVTRELLIVETVVDTRAGDDRPLLTFYPGAELHNDPTSWFGPNVSAVTAMLRLVGFDRVDLIHLQPVMPPPVERVERPWYRTLGRMRARAASADQASVVSPNGKVGRAAFHARRG